MESDQIKINIRISVSELKVEKFKNVLLYLLECCAGKPNKSIINREYRSSTDITGAVEPVNFARTLIYWGFYSQNFQ